MALKYKIASTYKPGEGKNGEKIFFPKLTGTSQVNIAEVAKRLAARSTASEGDVYLVIMDLVDLIPDLLAEGKTIKLDRLGTFRLHARVQTSNTSDKITVRDIKEIRLNFKPDNEMKNVLQTIDIEKDSD